MLEELVRGLFVNVSLLVTAAWVGSNVVTVTSSGSRSTRRLRRFARVPVAILLGYLLMKFPVPVLQGFFFDLRNVPATLMSIIGGPVVGMPVALGLAFYRYSLGGPGAVAGFISLGLGGIIGSLLRVPVEGNLNLDVKKIARNSLIVFTITSATMLLVPKTGVAFFKVAYLPLVAFQVAGSVLVALVIRSRLNAMRRERDTSRLAETDHLTGLFNARVLDRVLSTREGRHPACLILLDLDHFKQVNDTYGHTVGDEVLRRCAHVMKRTLRDDAWTFRYGGEEFAVLLHGCELAEAVPVAECLRHALAQTAVEVEGGSPVRVTVSGGLVQLTPGLGPKEAIDRADALLYEAKAQGRDRILADALAPTHGGEN